MLKYPDLWYVFIPFFLITNVYIKNSIKYITKFNWSQKSVKILKGYSEAVN
jgi:hypothetical protein